MKIGDWLSSPASAAGLAVFYAVRASAGLSTSEADVDRLVAAVSAITAEPEPPVPYEQDPATGDFWPLVDVPGWSGSERGVGSSCARG